MSVIFHLGYPKAASTTLQKSLFYNHPSIINLGSYPRSNIGVDDQNLSGFCQPYIEKDKRIKQLYKMLFHEQPIFYSKFEASQLFKGVIADYVSGSKPIVFSSEFALSVRFSLPDIVEKLRRVSDLGHAIKIIIIIRSQKDMLISLYRDHPFDPNLLGREKKYVALDNFIEIDRQTPFYSHCSSLDYFSLYQLLLSFFTAENILILPMEMLKDDLTNFSSKIASFCSLSPESVYNLLQSQHCNHGATISYNFIRRASSFVSPLQKIMPVSVKNLLKIYYKNALSISKQLGPKQSLNFSRESIDYIESAFGESNKCLSDAIQIDLSAFGYPVN